MNTFVYSPYPFVTFVLPHFGHLSTKVSLCPQSLQLASRSYTEIVLSGFPLASLPQPKTKRQFNSSATSFSASYIDFLSKVKVL